MKTFLLFIVVAVAAFGQTSGAGVIGETGGGQSPDRHPPQFMVHWQAEETDLTATYGTCTASIPSVCSMPTKMVDHYNLFALESSALEFASDIASTVEQHPSLTIKRQKFIGLYSIQAIGTKLTESRVVVPQAPPEPKIVHQVKVEKQ